MALRIEKQIYDNVHGYIGLTGLETKIVDTPIFQRLRNILQMGPAYYVYPGATHTRFAHCIGTMFMMQQFLENVRNDGELLTEDEDEIQKLRLAALLHDLGHYPFSHTAEYAIVHRLGGPGHEEFGAMLLKRFMSGILDNYRPQEITDIFLKKTKSQFSMLISSAFDADKSDYLLRDSYHTGVAYGRIGIGRLIRTMSIGRNRIVFQKDESIIENFLIGRYHMFRSVYHHKTAVSFCVLFERIFELLVEEGRLPHPRQIAKSGSEYDLSGYTDSAVYSAMHSYMRDGKNHVLKELVKMFLYRRPLQVAYMEPGAVEGKDVSKQNQVILQMQKSGGARKRFAEDAGIDPDLLFPVYMRPLSLIDESSKIYMMRRGRVAPLIESDALVLGMVGRKTLYDARIYSKGSDVKRIRRALA